MTQHGSSHLNNIFTRKLLEKEAPVLVWGFLGPYQQEVEFQSSSTACLAKVEHRIKAVETMDISSSI